MIGLGGAEFRLPLLIGLFRFLALQAVIVNKAMSLAVVLIALPARLVVVPYRELTASWLVAVSLLAGASPAPGPVPRGQPGWPPQPCMRFSPACSC
jgi:hypothetical protein